MKCTKCGKEVSPNQTFCSNCGAPVNLQSSEGANSYNERKGGVPVWLFIVVILLVVVIMLVAMFFMMKSNDSSDGNNEENEVSVLEDESYYSNNSISNSSNNSISNSSTNSSSSNTSTVSQSSTYKVLVGDYTIQMPDNLIYYTLTEDGETVLYVMDEDETWLAYSKFYNYAYSSIVKSKDNLSAALMQSGVTISSCEETTINGIDCLLYKATYSGINRYIAYVKINSMTVGYVEIFTDDYISYDDDALEEMVTVLSTAEQNVTTSTTRNLDTQDSMPKIDLSSILEEE